MKNIEILYDLLKTDVRFTDSEGFLLKNKIQEAATKMDQGLLSLLINNPETKNMFFSEVCDTLIFDKEKFNWIIDSKDFLPDSYTRYKNKIMLTDEKGKSIKNNDDVVLAFPCKDCLLEMDSTKETDDRQEVFFNETLMYSEIDTLLAPKVMAGAKKYNSSGVHDITSISQDDNLIIKGNNLLAMYSLLPRYKGKIKLMYWDILYNTDSDKVPYNDSFKHSSWLVMMKNRLEVARQLLKEDGVICLQCDDNEQAYLKVLCDEIFGRDNFINSICIKMSTSSGLKLAHRTKKVIKTKEYLLVYAKEKELITINPLYVIKDKWDDYYEWYVDKKGDNVEDWTVCNIKDIIKQNNLIMDMNNPEFKKFYLENADKIWSRGSAGNIPKDILDKSYNDWENIFQYTIGDNEVHYCYKGRRMAFLNKTIHECYSNDGNITTDISILLCDMWDDISTSALFSEGGVKLNNGKKPEILLHRIISMFSNPGDIVLDAYLGSGTTATVAHKMSRQYIGIEQLGKHMNMAVERLNNVITGEQSGISKTVGWNGGGSFVYCELAKNSQNMIDRINLAPESKLPALYDEIKSSDFISYKVDILAMDKEKDGFEKLSDLEKRQFLISIIDKNILYVNYADINDSTYKIDDKTKEFNKSFYESSS